MQIRAVQRAAFRIATSSSCVKRVVEIDQHENAGFGGNTCRAMKPKATATLKVNPIRQKNQKLPPREEGSGTWRSASDGLLSLVPESLGSSGGIAATSAAGVGRGRRQ